MPIYIEIKDGRQTSAMVADTAPDANHHLAPANFDWDTPYRLNKDGNIEPVPAAELAVEQLKQAKQRRRDEVEQRAEDLRTQLYTSSSSKTAVHMTKLGIAERILAKTADKDETALLEQEAKQRNITVAKLAKLIVDKSRELRTNLLPLEAYIVEAEQHIDAAKTVAEMDEKLGTLWQTVQQHYAAKT